MYKDTDSQTTRRVNVTELSPSQRREVFTDCMNQKGFSGFSKNKADKQTIYTFLYRN